MEKSRLQYDEKTNTIFLVIYGVIDPCLMLRVECELNTLKFRLKGARPLTTMNSLSLWRQNYPSTGKSFVSYKKMV